MPPNCARRYVSTTVTRAAPRNGPSAVPMPPMMEEGQRHDEGQVGIDVEQRERPEGEVHAHVVLHARVRVLAGLVELHAPAVDGGADGQVERHDGGAETLQLVRLGGVEHELEDPETAARELVATGQHVGARLGLDRLAEGALDPLALGPELLEDHAGARLEQREGPVGVVAEGLAEARSAVAGRARVDDGLDLEVLLARLPPEEDGVLVARDVMQDVGVRVLQLEDDRGEVVGGERVCR